MTAPAPVTRSPCLVGLFPELLGIGGIQEASRLTAQALSAIAQRHGWDICFLSLNDPVGTQVFSAGDRKIFFRGFGRRKLSFAFTAIGCAWRMAKNRANIVLTTHPHLALPAECMKWLAPAGFKVLVMSHGVEVWKPLPALRRRALLRADLALVPSRDTAQKLAVVQGVRRERIRKLPWPLNPDFLRLAESPDALRLPQGFPSGRVILTVGRSATSERYKGTDDLIRAVAQLRSAITGLHLVAIGGGDDLPRLRRLAYECGVSEGLVFLENLPVEEVAACYAHADIFAMPSTGEGFGLVFLEAMASGQPLVGADCGGTTDLIEDGVNGLLVPPDDFEKLVQALMRLLHDDSLRMEMSRRGAEIVRRKYMFENFEAGLESLLKETGLKADET